MYANNHFRLTICLAIGVMSGCASPPSRTVTQQPAPTIDSPRLRFPAADAVRNPALQAGRTTPVATVSPEAGREETSASLFEPEPASVAEIQQASHVTSTFALGAMSSLGGLISAPQAPAESTTESTPPQVPGAVPEDAAPPQGMTLEQLEQLALANNPAIREASAAARQAMGVRRQVGRCPNPSVGYFGSQLWDAGTEQNGAYINQNVVLGNKLTLNQRVLDQDVQVQLWEVETQRYRVLTDIRLRFFEALAAQRRMRLTEEFRQVAEQGVRIAQQRKEAMEGSQPEVLQAEIQLNEVVLSRRRAEFAFEAAWKELAATAGVPDMPPVELIGVLKPDSDAREWEAMYRNIVASSPQLRAAYSRIQRARANLERQRVQPIPNLQVQLQGGADNSTGTGLVNVQVGVPVPIFNKNRGNIDAAQSEYVRATQNARRLELALKARLAKVAQDFDSSAVTVRRYDEQILPKAQEMLDLSEQAYAAGEYNFLQILIARRIFFETNLDYVQALSELAQANATVNGFLLTGGLMPTSEFSGDDGLRGQALSQQ